MSPLSPLGDSQDIYALGLQKQVAAGAAASKGAGQRGPALSTGKVDPEKAYKAAQDFEAFFIGQMMEHMMAGIEPDQNFGGGTGEETWRSMLNQEYGKQIARTGKLGIANGVMTAMLRAQEERTAATTQPAVPANTAADAIDVTGVQGTAAVIPVLPTRR